MPEFWCKHHLVWWKLEIAWCMISPSGWGNSGITCLPMVFPELHAPRALSSVKINGIFSLRCLDNMGEKWCRAFLKMECPHLQVFHFYDYKWFLKMMMSKQLALREKLLYKLFLTSFFWVTLNHRVQAGVVLPCILEDLELKLYFIDIQAYKFVDHYAACQTGFRIFVFLVITRWFWLWLVDHNDVLMWWWLINLQIAPCSFRISCL